MEEAVEGPALLRADELLHALEWQFAQRLDVLNLAHHVAVVGRRDAREVAQELLRRERKAGLARALGRRRLVDADGGGLLDVRLLAAFLELAEDVNCLIRRGGPDDAQPREGDGEQNELGAQVDLRGRRVGLGGSTGVTRIVGLSRGRAMSLFDSFVGRKKNEDAHRG